MPLDKKPTYLIYSVKMMNYLVRQGNDMLGAVDSPKDPSGKYKAFVFEDTPKLQEDISNFTIINKMKEFTKHDQTKLSSKYNRRRI